MSGVNAVYVPTAGHIVLPGTPGSHGHSAERVRNSPHYDRGAGHEYRRIESPSERTIKDSTRRDERKRTKPLIPEPSTETRTPPARTPAPGHDHPRSINVRFRQI